jgi:anti-sigma factor RsiW
VTSCAEVRAELVAALRGETTPEAASEIARHLARCAACAAERDALRATMEAVHAHVQPEVSADARMRLASALSDEFADGRRRARRRILRPIFALPAAVAAGVLLAWGASSPRAPDSTERTAAHAERVARAADVAGEIGPKAIDAASRGLAWLTAGQRADGSWAPTDVADAETTAATTAAALLAFAADGQTPHRGPRAAALLRARDRLAHLVSDGFSTDADKKPIYALSLGVRSLATSYRLDHGSMTAEERRGLREVLGDAGRRLVDWQGDDGGFGYSPRAPRSDSSCTLFAAAAMRDLKDAGLMDAGGAYDRAMLYLASMPGEDGALGYQRAGHQPSPALTAEWLALETDRLGAAKALSTVEDALTSRKDALLAWTGFTALARHKRPLAAPVANLLAAQAPDGAWTAKGDSRCETAGDAVTTAFGVMAMAQVYSR